MSSDKKTPLTLQQKRAQFALKRIQEWTGCDEDKQKKLKSYAQKMPFMIHANGLGQTAAFYCAKKKDDPHYDLYKLLQAWLTESEQAFANYDDLLEGITNADMHTYMLAQAEAMLFLSWVKQFSVAFLKGE